MIDAVLYLPDYPIGHLIAFQVEAQMEKSGDFGSEFERMAKDRQRRTGHLDDAGHGRAGGTGGPYRGRREGPGSAVG